MQLLQMSLKVHIHVCPIHLQKRKTEVNLEELKFSLNEHVCIVYKYIRSEYLKTMKRYNIGVVEGIRVLPNPLGFHRVMGFI